MTLPRFIVCLALALPVLAEDLPEGNVELDLGGGERTVENWKWGGWNGYSFKLRNGTLTVTGVMAPRHGYMEIGEGGVLRFSASARFVPGASDAAPRKIVVKKGGVLDLAGFEGFDPFNASLVVETGGVVIVDREMPKGPPKFPFRVALEGGKLVDLRRAEDGVKRRLERMAFVASGDSANRTYFIEYDAALTTIVEKVVFDCPEFGEVESRLPYFHRRYPEGASGPFRVTATVFAKNGARKSATVEIPWNPNPVRRFVPAGTRLLGTVSYGPGRERHEMVTNDLGNLYVRWNAAPQLLPENAGAEWMGEAEKRGIRSMTIYTHLGEEQCEKIKTAWGERFLGDNCGERTGFLYGSRKEMRGPQDRDLTSAREWFLSKFVRGYTRFDRGAKGKCPYLFATSGAAFANYELQGGVDFICNEMYAVGCGNLTYATAEARGAARRWGAENWAAWLAHEWQTFGIPYQKDEKYLSLEAGIKSLHLMGTALQCLESGSSGTQAHPYTWGADRKGYRYDDEPPRRYRETLRKCFAFIREHPLGTGTPETRIALALGMNDGYLGQNRDDIAPWGQHTNRIVHLKEKVNVWACSHPEWTWDRCRETFFPWSGTTGVSGTPYGQVDVVGIDDESRLSDLARYRLIVFGGWNTMSVRAKRVLERWMDGGGTLVMCTAQLTTRTDRDFLGYGTKDLLPVAGVRPGFSGEVVRKKFGRGEFILFDTKEFPGANRELGERWKKLLRETAARIPQRAKLVADGDEGRFFNFAVYGDGLHVLNLDMHTTRTARFDLGGRIVSVELGPLEMKDLMLWPEPTREMKPWVYNWWMGNAVDDAGLEYQCRELADKGFGGFHVIPIYGATNGYEKCWRKLLSPEWIDAWNLAAEKAGKYGLGIDLTMGSGWCFGGPWVTPELGASSGMKVKRACPGGEGLMIDPFSAEAMKAHVAAFEPFFGRNGRAARPRAFYHDSFEYFEAQPRNGTDLDAGVLACFRVWTDWCRENGYLTRNEAHGAPSNWLDLYALADIPETEMFGRKDRDVLISKFASSAAHVKGTKLVSAESCTWLDEHFRERPEDIKIELDQLFLSGVNHVFYHGCCYSPVEAVWPGWCFYASLEMNPRNPIWREMGALNAYATRCQSIFQTWEADNDLALVWEPELWRSRGNRGKQMTVHERGWFYDEKIGKVAKRLWDEGCQFDYVSPKMVKERDLAKYRAVIDPEDGRWKALADAAERSPFNAANGLTAIRLRKGGRRLWFVVNHGEADRAIKGKLTVMDPLDGGIFRTEEHLLRRWHSAFIGYEGSVSVAAADSPKRKPIPLEGPWQATAICGGPALKVDEFFSGTMLYRRRLDLDPAGNFELDLGDVREIARVRMNGRDLGVRFMAPYRYAIPSDVLRRDGNDLEIEVTNLGSNRLRWNDLNGVKWKYFSNANMKAVDYSELDASKYDVLPSGLLGPVTLRPLTTGKEEKP